MPLISVNATPGAFDQDSKYRLVTALTAASAEAESLPAGTERQCVVIWNDTAEVYMGGEPAVPALFVVFTVADGVLDPVRRATFAAAVQAAAEAGERRVFTSVVFSDVPEGRWGIGGGIMRLPEMAAAAGMQHLSALRPPERHST